MAWLILAFFQVKNTVSYYTQLRPWPLEEDNSNLALVGVGLASAKPKSSVMDPTQSAPPQVVIMEPSPQTVMVEAPSPIPPMSPEVVHVAVPVTAAPAPMAMSPSPASMGSPVMLTPALSPSA